MQCNEHDIERRKRAHDTKSARLLLRNLRQNVKSIPKASIKMSENELAMSADDILFFLLFGRKLYDTSSMKHSIIIAQPYGQFRICI